jgi:radical SAM protein with 4Fe4S-binding SPASM domain
MSYENKYITIAPHCALKRLEEPYLYDIENDELYELNEEAYQFLLACSRGEDAVLKKDEEEFIRYCLSEKLLALSHTPVKGNGIPEQSPVPSLRYLEFQLTDRCNLRCRHCYIGEGSHQDLPCEAIPAILKEFERIQGLRLLLSGGEPLVHPRFWEINEVLREYAFRSIMLSNGVLITHDIAKRLAVHEVQVSLDGMRAGHEAIRGEGTFTKTLSAIDCLQDAGIQVSIATMIHQANLTEFESLAALMQARKIREWNVDLPSIAGRMEKNRDLWVSPAEAGAFLRYGYGGGLHSSEKDSTCGAHLCAILADGKVAKCGLFSRESVGSIAEGLRTCWERLPRIGLKELTCDCALLDECRGGCRYRARLQGDIFKPDLFQCYARGVVKGGEGDDHQKGD